MSDDKHGPTPSRSRPRWIAGSLLVALLISVGYRLHHGRPLPGEPLRGSALIGSELVHSGAPVAMKAPLMTAKPGADGAAGTLEICGRGRVQLDPDDPAAAGRYMEVLTAKARNRCLATLLDSDDTRARAAGLFLLGKLNASEPVQPMAEQSRDALDALDALVQLALGAGDPFVYAMAAYACNGYSDPSPS